MPVKNEDWILEYTLSCASKWADYIIIADQNSTDGTVEICKKFEKVVYINNPLKELNMSHTRQLLLDKAREYWNENLLFCLDADEILSMNIINDDYFHLRLNQLNLWQSVELEWLNIWGDVDSVRKDGIWWGVYKHFIFRDDWKWKFWDKATSEPRMPEIYMNDSIKIESIKNLHYQFVDRERMLAKQRRYRVYDYINSPVQNFWKAFKINLMYYSTKEISPEVCVKIDEHWISNELHSKIRLNSKKYWYNDDVLLQILKYEPGFFRWLDIWDFDWLRYSQWRVTDGRTITQKWYHKIQILLYYLNKLVPQLIKNKL